MFAQLDRQPDRRPFEPNPAHVAQPGRRPERCGPAVSVLGPAGGVAGLAAHLPAGWSVRYPRVLAEVGPDDIVLLCGAAAATVTAARAALSKHTRVVALLAETATAAAVADVLTAGAHGCVRAGRPAILAGHLVACRRRQVAERWSAYQPTRR